MTSTAVPAQKGAPPRGLPPGPRVPGVAQTFAWFFRPVPFIERCRQRYGEIFTLGLGPGRNTVVVATPELAREVITGDPAIYRAGDANGLLRPVVGPNSLLVLDGDRHVHHRRILLPAFGQDHVGEFARRVEAITASRIRSWRPGQSLSLLKEMEAISLEAIISVVLGDDEEDRLDRLRGLIPDMMRRAGSPLTILPYFRHELGGLTPYARLREVLAELDQLFFDATRARRANGEAGGDALSLLIAATDAEGRGLAEREIRDELLTMIMAGYETTTSALAWSFERLLRSPRPLGRLLDEIGSGEETYLDAVVRESLRIRPVVPVVARKVATDVELGGHRIPAGSVLMASIYLLHRDGAVFEDPEEFRPERFLNGGPRQIQGWFPFGGGVRRCLGASFAQLEMKIVLRTVLGAIRLHAPDSRPEPPARRRFTFAPGRGADAVVEKVGAAG